MASRATRRTSFTRDAATYLRVKKEKRNLPGALKVIQNMKLSHMCRLDSTNSNVFKSTKEPSSLFLTFIVTRSREQGHIPYECPQGKVVPIFRGGDKSSPLNYRPISLTNIPCNIMEHVIFSAISSHLERNNFFFAQQCGCRKRFPCEVQLPLFTFDVICSMDRGVQTHAVFLDLKKHSTAFHIQALYTSFRSSTCIPMSLTGS